MGRCLSCSQENCRHRIFCDCNCHDDEDAFACSGCERPVVFCRCSPNVAANTGSYPVKQKFVRQWYQNRPKVQAQNHSDQHHAHAETHVFYAVRNRDGMFYKTYSKSGSGRGWVKDLATSRVYAKASMARATITRLANEFPKLPIPELVEFHVTEIRVIPQEDRVAESRQKKLIMDQQRAERNAQYRIKLAEETVAKAQAELERLRRR